MKERLVFESCDSVRWVIPLFRTDVDVGGAERAVCAGGGEGSRGEGEGRSGGERQNATGGARGRSHRAVERGDHAQDTQSGRTRDLLSGG